MGIRVDGEGLGQITRVFSVTQYTHIKSFTQKKSFTKLCLNYSISCFL